MGDASRSSIVQEDGSACSATPYLRWRVLDRLHQSSQRSQDASADYRDIFLCDDTAVGDAFLVCEVPAIETTNVGYDQCLCRGRCGADRDRCG